MTCLQCGTENPEQAKFCLSCGAKLALVCPECGTELPPLAKFCFGCGTPMGAPPPTAPPPAPVAPAPSAAERMAERLQRLVPKEFAERLLAAKGKVEGERRIVTILFSDIKGSTAMAEEMDPEDVMEIMDGAFDVLIEPIYRHEGTLARLMGDAVLAFFGAPISHENDPERACRAALEIVEGAERYAAHLEKEQGIQGFNVRVGINTGLVVVGEVGSDLRVEYTAMGDAINLAARMEQNAPVGGILISRDTYQHVRGLFDVHALDPITVKGKAEPVQVYVVQRAKPRAFRLETRGVAGVETRMIGRDAELKRLQDAFYLAMEDRERQMVTISGEAGVGKSRLLYEFEDWIELLPEPIRHFKGRASQEMQSLPYALLRDLFAFQFQIRDSDRPEVVREKMERGIGEVLGAEQGQMKAHFVGQLLGFGFGDSLHLRGSLDDAQQLRDRALIYLGEFFQAVTASNPTIVFLEDIHWADDSSLDAINHLALALPGQRLLVVCLTRPYLFERRPHWGEGQEFHSRVELSPLSKRDSRQLVTEILQKAGQVPQTLRELVIGGAEGNPFYIEELIKMLIEDGVIVRGEAQWQVEPDCLARWAIRVSPSLAAILQARLDSLPLPERTTLQRAAVVGRTFWGSAVEQIGRSAEAEPEEEIADVLSALRDREMISTRETSSFADTTEYVFKHSILRDVTYEGILKRVRRVYHKLIAEWLIEHAGQRVGEYAGLIAEHLELARETERAIAYLRQAGEQAVAQFANVQAVDYFSRALKLLEQVDWDPARVREERYALLLGREGVYGLLGERAAQVADLADLEALAEEMDDGRRRAEVAQRRGLYYEAISDFSAALKAAQETVHWAERAADPRRKTQGLVQGGIALWQQGAFGEARDQLAEALALAEQHNDQRSKARSLLNLGNVLYLQGNSQGAHDYYEQALAIYRALAERRGEALVLSNLVPVFHGFGDLAKARACSQQAMVIYQTIGDRRGGARPLINLAVIQQAIGDLQAACESYEQALDLYRATGDRGGEALALKNLGLTHHDLGENLTARQHCEQALAIEREIGDRNGEGYSLTYLALALEGLGELEEATAAYQEALSLRQEIGQAALAIDDLAGLARVALKQDQVEQALNYAQKALAWIAEHGLEGIEYPLRIYLTAADALTAAGQRKQAAECLTLACTLLDEQAACISDEGTRRSFLENVPLHRELRERTCALE